MCIGKQEMDYEQVGWSILQVGFIVQAVFDNGVRSVGMAHLTLFQERTKQRENFSGGNKSKSKVAKHMTAWLPPTSQPKEDDHSTPTSNCAALFMWLISSISA